jgi:hypothetical protein
MIFFSVARGIFRCEVMDFFRLKVAVSYLLTKKAARLHLKMSRSRGKDYEQALGDLGCSSVS